MIRRMSIYITDARKLRGGAWAAKYPDKADDLWLVAQVGGKKKRKRIGPPTEENRKVAEQKAAEWRFILERRSMGEAGMIAVSFSEAADTYLKRGLRKRAPKTVRGREYQAGVLKNHFGTTAIDQIDADAIATWWDEFVEEGARDVRTGRSYLNVLSMIFKHAARTHKGLANPVSEARERIIGEIQNTAAYRARDQENCNPVAPEEMAKLLPELERYGNEDLLLTVLLMYEGGLRIAEALGLQWGDVWWGKDDSDTSRHLHIQRTRSNSDEGGTKSGRRRKVSLSRRLRSLLLERYMAIGRPAAGTWIVEQHWTKNIRERMTRVCKRAGIAPHRPKDFRDTYASTLVTHGIVLKWISIQLGHASLAVTERHYASYMAVDGYRNPWMVSEGQLPPDLFSALDGWAGTKKAPTGTKNAKLSKIQGNSC